jgi:hypothetical protein
MEMSGGVLVVIPLVFPVRPSDPFVTKANQKQKRNSKHVPLEMSLFSNIHHLPKRLHWIERRKEMN